MQEIIIIGSICILSYILLLRNFSFSLYVLILLSVLLHKELFSFYKWDLLPVRAFMLALLAAGVTRLVLYLIKTKDFKSVLSKLKDPIPLTFILLWVVRLVSIVNSKNIQSSIFLLGFFTCSVALVLYIYFTYKDRPLDVIKYLRFYIYTAFALTLFGWFQLYLYQTKGIIIGALWNIPGNISRVGATFWDVNHYGALLSALLPLLGVTILIGKNKITRVFDVVMFLSMFAALLLTNSRTAWIMAGVTFFIFISVLIFRKIGFRGVLYLVLALTVISIPFAREYSIKSSPFRARIKQYFHYRMDSFDSHFMLLTGAFQIFEKYPLIGGGYGSFFEHFSVTKIAPTYFSRDPAALNTRVPAHTIWGELVAETGILGILAFISFILSISLPLLYGALKLEEKKGRLISAVFFSTIVGWLTAGIFYSYNSEFFWIILALFSTWGVGAVFKHFNPSSVYNFFLKSDKFAFVVIFVLSALLIFTNLGKNHFIPYDEAIYAKIAKNMVLDKEYFVQQWFPLKVWYEKPPLYMWFAAGFMNILGFTELAARMPSAIAGLATIILIFFVGKKMFNKTVGFLASFTLLTTTQYLYYTRMAMTDVTTTLFISLALFSYLMVRDKNKNVLYFIPGALIGLAVMTKGVVGLLPFPIILLYELYLLITKENKFSWKFLMPSFFIFFGFIGVALPWHIYMYRMFGSTFLRDYIGYHVWDRAVASIEDKGRPFYWYLIVLKVSMRLWAVVLLGSIPFILRRIFKGDRKIGLFVFWAGFVFVFFSIATSKLVWYIIPIYPALSILIAVAVDRFLNFLMRRFKKLDTHLFKTLALLFIFVGSLVYLYFNRVLVYNSDLTGAEAELLKVKDEKFGIKTKVFIDRMDIPLALYYTNSPFEIIDFRADRFDRVPIVTYEEPMILLTKLGRYSEIVVGKDYPPEVVQKNGDWVLWYFVSQKDHDTKSNSLKP